MVYFTEKKIKGKKYLYAVQSIRLRDGKVTKISKLVKDKILTSELKDFFNEKEKELFGKESIISYKTDSIFTKDQILKIEATRQEYKNILRKLTKAQLKDLFDRFTSNFTYESNAIEGNSLTLKDVAIVLFEGKVIAGKELREIYETRNSREVVELILKNKFNLIEKT